jgi:HD-like signal output (HDOD) protein
VVGPVAATASSPNCSAEALAKVVMQDQALSIRLLKLANSSAYARGRSVDSVKEAVQRIGANEVRSLVTTLGVVQQYQGKAAEHVDPRLFWEHSIACGLIAASIAEAVQAPNVDDCFLWGLLHDVGRIIMLDHVPEAYAAVFEAAEALDLPLEMIEPRLMLLDHCNILEQALEFWQFPRSFIVPVANHHLSLARIKRLGPQHEKPTIAVALADRLAHALLLGGSGNDVVYPIDELVEALGIQGPVLRRIEESVVTEAENLKLVMLAKTADEPWPDFLDATRKRLARPASALFVSKDPQIDAFRIVFERLAPHRAGDPPDNRSEGHRPDDGSADDTSGSEHSAGHGPRDFNLGVIHMNNQSEQALLLERFAQAEREAGCESLPLLIITDKGGLADHRSPRAATASSPPPSASTAW